jgi:hypothetical protein
LPHFGHLLQLGELVIVYYVLPYVSYFLCVLLSRRVINSLTIPLVYTFILGSIVILFTYLSSAYSSLFTFVCHLLYQ